MQNFISTFSPSKSFQFVNEQLSWEQGSSHRSDCHDPPHAARVGLHDDRSPPRRLAAVAGQTSLRTTLARVGGEKQIKQVSETAKRAALATQPWPR
jgi:hypothetical protein